MVAILSKELSILTNDKMFMANCGGATAEFKVTPNLKEPVANP